MATEIRTLCGMCPSNCGLLVRLEGRRIASVRGDPEHPVNRGRLCAKGLASPALADHPGRLRYPQRWVGEKGGSGRWQRLTWAEAYDYLAERLGALRDRHGPQVLAKVRGAPLSDDITHAFDRLFNLLGTPNLGRLANLCHGARSLAHELTFGDWVGERARPFATLAGSKARVAEADLPRAGCVVVWGANPLASNDRGIAWGRRLLAAKRRGAHLLVIDPLRSETARLADVWVRIKPGTDGALALGLLREISERGLYDREFVERWTVGFEALREAVAPYSPARVEAVTGVPAAVVQDLAATLSACGPTAIYEGNGLDMHLDTFATMRAICCLKAILGWLDAPGGNVFLDPPLVPNFWAPRRPDVPHVGEEKVPLAPLTGQAILEAALNGKPYPIKGLLVTHSNPVLTYADEGYVRRALMALDFLVVVDIFFTRTAELADLVLPAACFWEKSFLQSYVDLEGPYFALRRRVTEPPGEAKPEWEMERELAEILGYGDHYPWETEEAFLEYLLVPSGLSLHELAAVPFARVSGPTEYFKYRQRGFPTPSGKVELYSSFLAERGYAPLPRWEVSDPAPAEEREYPFVGITGRYQGVYVHSRYRNLPSLRRQAPYPLARLHPADMAALGLDPGEAVKIVSPLGAVVMTAATGDVPPGVVALDCGWGNPWDGEANVNRLVGAGIRDPVISATSNRWFRCRLERAELEATSEAPPALERERYDELAG